ncbi:MAG: hypothetical protein IKX26_03115 [Bacteroidales bacterium]|nr:hypothetical protein [Bacteroidales bacterium]
MESEKMLITNKNFVIYDALDKIDNYLEDLKLGAKDTLHMRLLAEETLGMLGAMAGDYRSLVWFEKDQDVCKLQVIAKTEMDIDKKKEILSVSKSGVNDLAKGFMGKIGDIIENGFLNYENVMKLQQQYGGGYVDYAALGGRPSGETFCWSLEQYKDALDEVRDSDEAAGTAWDELEKSIVARLADDVIVGVKKDEIEFTIVSKLLGK